MNLIRFFIGAKQSIPKIVLRKKVRFVVYYVKNISENIIWRTLLDIQNRLSDLMTPKMVIK